MQEEQDPSQDYIKGFNQMYKLKQEMPEAAQQILSAKSDNDRFRGMHAGAKQFELERIREVTQKGRSQVASLMSVRFNIQRLVLN